MNINKYDTFVVPPGIGDFAWVYMKLCNLGHDFSIEISSPQDGKGNNRMRRAGGLMELLPKVKSYKYLDDAIWLNDSICKLSNNRLWIQANLHLETGNRIETFLPNIPTNLHFDINLPECNEYDKIVLYTASLKANMNWKGWMFEEWVELISAIDNVGKKDKIVLIGAEWDRDYLWYFEHFSDIDLRIGRPLGEILALISNAKVVVGFPSGIPIMSTILKTPTVMFYPQHLEKMMYTFNDPDYDKYYCAVYGTEGSKPARVINQVLQWL